MSRFILVRVVIGFCLLVVLSTVTFAIYASIPVEAAGFLVDLQRATGAQIAAAHQALGLDHSIYYRYGDYMAHLVRGDFGVAWSTLGIGYDGRIHGQPVGHMMLQAAGVTGSVILGGAVVLVLIAVPLALISARFPRSPLDRAVVAVSLIGDSTHPLVIGARAAAALQRPLALARRWILQLLPAPAALGNRGPTSSRPNPSRSAKGQRTGRPT